MTIRDASNYCPTCEEVCHHHPTVCTVCGSTLEAVPAATATASNRRNNRSTNTTTRRTAPTAAHSMGMDAVIPQDLVEETRQAGRELRQLLTQVRQSVQQTAQEQADLLQQVQTMQQEWQAVPAALMDPTAVTNNNSNSRPTSKAFLDQLPRIQLTEHSPLLYQVLVRIDQDKKGSSNNSLEVEGVLGDFEMNLGSQQSETTSGTVQTTTITGPLVVGHPRTGKGGLSAETKRRLVLSCAASNNDNPAVLLLERGDGVTFVQKALMAQEAGAAACIVANHVSEPWPYVMKDSRGEAVAKGLRIPVIMISKSHAEPIFYQANNNNNNINNSNNTTTACLIQLSKPPRHCVVCTDAFAPGGATVLQLPACGHVFHEDCLLQWLNKHNTCPFCRRELPTDDAEYEQERRRRMTTQQSGNGGGRNNGNYEEDATARTVGGGGASDFYG